MTTSALLDLILTHTEEVGASDNENVTLRARILARAQEVLDKVWQFAEWDFKMVSTPASVTMTASGVASLPTDFGDFGDDGGVYISGQRWPMRYLTPKELMRRLNVYQASQTNPDYYTVSGYDASVTTGDRKITVYPTPSGTITLLVYYNKITPTLADATNATNNLQCLPAQYHYPIMVEGLKWLTAVDKGDARDKEFYAWFDKEMKTMKSKHVFGREDTQTMGMLGGISAYRSW